MSEYVSNCPISRPVRVDWKANWDLGDGMAFSFEKGFFYKDPNEYFPIRLPPPDKR